MLSQFEYSVPSQVITQSKYNSQRNKDQYCSNIALKLNGKLANAQNCGRAWSNDHSNGLPWFSEVPTLLMGLCISHDQGQETPSYVVGTVCLDRHGLQTGYKLKIQKKSSFIARSVLKDITKSLTLLYEKSVGKAPQRVIVYRDGLSDGSFSEAEGEIQAVRQAFYDLNTTNSHARACSLCNKKGCLYCTPAITYVIAQNDHGIKMVPSNNSEGFQTRGAANVHSGTCLDHTITGGMQNLAVKDETLPPAYCFPTVARNTSVGFDFLLTAQGGLKGTSKPVYYRVLRNENLFFCGERDARTSLTRDKLEKLTYHLSFLYTTASKAPRSIPIVYYSKSLANQAMGWIATLTRIGRIGSEPTEDGDEVRFFRSDSENIQSDDLLPGFSVTSGNPKFPKFPFRPCGMICAMAKRG